MIHSLKESRKARESVAKYVCKEIQGEIIAGTPSLDGEMKRVTLLFSDLRNFTGLVEKNHPKHVVKIMNQYFTEMNQAVKAHKGLILQYVGDAIEAVFGAPVGFEDHPEMAVKAAIEIKSLEPGQVLKIVATDEAADEDFRAWSRKTGNTFLDSRWEGEVLEIFIRKG